MFVFANGDILVHFETASCWPIATLFKASGRNTALQLLLLSFPWHIESCSNTQDKAFMLDFSHFGMACRIVERTEVEVKVSRIILEYVFLSLQKKANNKLTICCQENFIYVRLLYFIFPFFFLFCRIRKREII